MSMFYNEDDQEAAAQGGGAPAATPAPAPEPTMWDKVKDSAAGAANWINEANPITSGKTTPFTRDPRLNQKEDGSAADEIAKFAKMDQQNGKGDNSKSAKNPLTGTPWNKTADTRQTPAEPMARGDIADLPRSYLNKNNQTQLTEVEAGTKASKEAKDALVEGEKNMNLLNKEAVDRISGSTGRLESIEEGFQDRLTKVMADHDAVMKMAVEDTPAQTFFKTIGNIMGTVGYSLMAKAGRPELAVQMMDKSLEREYRAQQDKKAEKGRKLGELKDSLQFIKGAIGDERLSALTWEAAGTRKYMALMDQAAREAGTESARKNNEAFQHFANAKLAGLEEQMQQAMRYVPISQAGNLQNNGVLVRNPATPATMTPNGPIAPKPPSAKGKPKQAAVTEPTRSPVASYADTPQGNIASSIASFADGTLAESGRQAAPDQGGPSGGNFSATSPLIQSVTSKIGQASDAAKGITRLPDETFPSDTLSKATNDIIDSRREARGTAVGGIVNKSGGVDTGTQLAPSEVADIKSGKEKDDNFDVISFEGSARPYLVRKGAAPQISQDLGDLIYAKETARKYAEAYDELRKAAGGKIGVTTYAQVKSNPKFATAYQKYSFAAEALEQALAKTYDPKSVIRENDLKQSREALGLSMRDISGWVGASTKTQPVMDATALQAVKSTIGLANSKIGSLKNSNNVRMGTKVWYKIDGQGNIYSPSPGEVEAMSSNDHRALKAYIRPDYSEQTLETL